MTDLEAVEVLSVVLEHPVEMDWSYSYLEYKMKKAAAQDTQKQPGQSQHPQSLRRLLNKQSLPSQPWRVVTGFGTGEPGQRWRYPSSAWRSPMLWPPFI